LKSDLRRGSGTKEISVGEVEVGCVAVRAATEEAVVAAAEAEAEAAVAAAAVAAEKDRGHALGVDIPALETGATDGMIEIGIAVVEAEAVADVHDLGLDRAGVVQACSEEVTTNHGKQAIGSAPNVVIISSPATLDVDGVIRKDQKALAPGGEAVVESIKEILVTIDRGNIGKVQRSTKSILRRSGTNGLRNNFRKAMVNGQLSSGKNTANSSITSSPKR